MNSKWQRKKAQASHADDWLMTYADMITLLLCFFVIFLIVEISKKNLPHQETPPAPQVSAPVAPPPPPPFQGNLPFHDLDPADYADDPPPAPAAVTPAPAVPVETPPPIVAAAPAPVPEPPAASSPPEAPPGDRILIVEMNSEAFFGSGSATLSVAGKTILHGVAEKLKADEYRDYRITIEGHTDDTPISTSQFPSNWELSTARAAAVARFFLEEGLSAQRLRAAGYADTFPKLPNRDAAGRPIPENQAKNRRVVIKLEKIEKTER